MRSLFMFLLLAAPFGTTSIQGADSVTALLAVPGKVIYESPLDASPGAPWRIAKGQWDLSNGTWKGAEKAEDHHGAVARLPNSLPDFILEYEFMFDGARSTSLSINAIKGHLARLLITPSTITLQRDDSDHTGPDKAVVFARFNTDFQPGTWHKVRMEMVGDTLLGQVDDQTAYGSNDLFKTQKTMPGFTVGGQAVLFRNLKITEATLNPNWEVIKTRLPAPGTQLAPPATREGKPSKKPA